ncbi:MAG: hypothetical protein QNJ94_07030 [Alphaproteobacteria bacterium]|nr:hypothetical protein [Alphaproteobacteria bacterium]
MLGQNIANADTPDYRARELKDSRFQALMQARTRPVKLATTVDSHFPMTGAAHLAPTTGGTPSLAADPDFRPVTPKPEGEVGPTGNTVDLESDVVKASETAAEYQLITSLYRKHINMIRLALGRGR